jgi:hypothetical protein
MEASERIKTGLIFDDMRGRNNRGIYRAVMAAVWTTGQH